MNLDDTIPNHAGVRWYELRDSGSGWSINQQGTYAPDAKHRWMGSIAMDSAGDIALGFSVSGPTTFPSIGYAGRLPTDAPGALAQGEATLKAGAGSQTSSSNRWGDYSMLAVDPADDCTFWYTQEYYATTSGAGWQTRIGSFKFPSCPASGGGASADLSLTKSGAPNPVAVGSNLTYTLKVTNNGPSTATGIMLSDPLPTSVTLVSAAPSQGSCSGTSSVTCSLGTIATGGTATVTIVVTATTAGTITNTASVSANESDPNLRNNTASASTTANGTCGLVTASSTPASVTYTSAFQTKTINLKITNSSGVSVTVTSIQRQAGKPFSVLSISPALPKTIPTGNSQVFSVTTRLQSGLRPPQTATAPYFNTSINCQGATIVLKTADLELAPPPLTVERMSLAVKGAELRLTVEGRAIESMQLQLFDLGGRKLIDQISGGSRLTLPLATDAGQPLANGVYLYLVTVRGSDGRMVRSDVKKIVVLR